MKCRVIYKSDGTVSVLHPAPKAQKPDESDDDFLERVYQKWLQDQILNAEALDIKFEIPDYDDIEPSELPDRKDRDKWRGQKGKGIFVDDTVITIKERRQAVEDELDAELEKTEPDPVKLIKLQRKLQKREY